MEGQEISEVMLSEAVNVTGGKRWDSEYYKKEFMLAETILDTKQTLPLRDYCSFIKKGIFDLSPEAYITEGIPLIRTSEIKNPQINFSTTVYLDQRTHSDNYKTELEAGDLVFTKVGAGIGDVAMLPPKYTVYNFSQNVAGAKIKEKKNSAYILAFLLSDFGKKQILRSSMLSGQGKLELDDIRNYKIPIVNDDFKYKIADILFHSETVKANSELMYKKAEELLLEELGLNNWQCSRQNVVVKSIKESFDKTGRIDAEYYQPKYKELLDWVLKYNCKLLGELVSIKKSVEPGSEFYREEGIPFIRVSDINKFGISKTEIHLSPQEFNLATLQPRKDTILLSKDGTIGIAYKCESDLPIITSSALLHLNLCCDDILPDYLTVVLNSFVVQMQAERDSNGGIIQHWNMNEIDDVIIPILSMQKQQLIAEKVRKSFALREESKQLLEQAKLLVEKEIEK